MAKPQGPRFQQFEVKACPGSESWVIVRHRGGSFKLPADAPLSELLRGVSEGWTLHKRAADGTPKIRRYVVATYTEAL